MDALKNLATSIKRRVSPSLQRMLRLGYLNEEFKRTQDGLHTIANFIEDNFSKEFEAYLVALEKEKIEDAKKAKGCDK